MHEQAEPNLPDDPPPDERLPDSRVRDRERDSNHLAALRAAQAVGDGAAARAALARLLEPYVQVTRTIAYAQLRGVSNREDEANRIMQDTMFRVIKALNKGTEMSGPFHAVVAANRGFALKDFWRERKRGRDLQDDLKVLVARDGAVEPRRTTTEQARDFAAYLEKLPDTERALVTERVYLGLTPLESAERHGMTRNAVDQAYHRAMKKLRASEPRSPVRNPITDTA
jgi:RNA polymerase sigma-70 factor, ECF subfamily